MTHAWVHLPFEALAYFVALALLRRARARSPEAVDAHPSGGLVLAGAAVGAAVGSKLLWIAQFGSWLLTQPWWAWMGGKTVVGGVLGGWAGVELVKRGIGYRASTGDRLVVPLLVALAVGRLGCVAAGPEDHTAGLPTTLPWGITGADGVRVHPMAAYEAVAALAAAAACARLGPPAVPGRRFLQVVGGYLVFRLLVDFAKAPFGPGPPPDPDLWGSLTPIQWACVAGAGVAAARYTARHG